MGWLKVKDTSGLNVGSCYTAPMLRWHSRGKWSVFIVCLSLKSLSLFSVGRSRHKVGYSTTQLVQMVIQSLPRWHLSAARWLYSLFQPRKRPLKSLYNLLLSDPFTSLKVKGAIKKNVASNSIQQAFTFPWEVIRFYVLIGQDSKMTKLGSRQYVASKEYTSRAWKNYKTSGLIAKKKLQWCQRHNSNLPK